MRQFLALAALVVFIGLGLINAIWPPQPPLLVDARVQPISAAPAVWPTNTSLSAPVTPDAIVTAKVIKPPPAPVSRAKFPNEDPAIVDGLALANKAVNQIISYADDGAHYGAAQVMVSWPPDFKGDCEDYALTKMVMLEDAGLPIVEFARLRFVYAPGLTGQLGGHALLEVRMPKGAVAFLDNNFDELMTRAELDARGFKFFDW